MYSLYRLYPRVAQGNFLQFLRYLLVDLGLYSCSCLLLPEVLRSDLLRSHSPLQLRDLQVRERPDVALLVAEECAQTYKPIWHAGCAQLTSRSTKNASKRTNLRLQATTTVTEEGGEAHRAAT